MNLLLLPLALVCLTTTGLGAPVDPQRVIDLPAGDQPAWHAYLDRSKAAAAKDEAALREELSAHAMNQSLRAPSGGDFKLPAKPGDAWFGSPEAAQLADVVLSYQTPSGGWSKHIGYAKGRRKPGMQWSSQYEPGDPPHYLATFDNRSTTEQMLLLANVWRATHREECKVGFIKGLNFILDAQYPNGGWPQVYPLEGKYHDDITFNDDAMTRVLRLLRDIVDGEDPAFSLVDSAQRARVAEALKAGIDCVLKTQLEMNGKTAVWCAQYDPITLRPANARAMEPATLSGVESARLLEFLMSIRNPPHEIVHAVEDGLAWFESAKVTGITRTKRPSDGKMIYVADPKSSDVYWARFYDLKTGKPVFPGRDGVLYDTFEAMAARNKVGYDYYSTQPGSLLGAMQKKWRKMLVTKPTASTTTP